jgi:hypothetical protein
LEKKYPRVQRGFGVAEGIAQQKVCGRIAGEVPVEGERALRIDRAPIELLQAQDVDACLERVAANNMGEVVFPFEDIIDIGIRRSHADVAIAGDGDVRRGVEEVAGEHFRDVDAGTRCGCAGGIGDDLVARIAIGEDVGGCRVNGPVKADDGVVTGLAEETWLGGKAGV